MTEQTATAIIIPFPKRHRAINPVIPARAVAPAANKTDVVRPVTGKLTALTAEPAITGLASARPPAKKPMTITPTMMPLSRVISDLDAALTQQNAAVARWRNAIQDLRNAIDGLDGSLKQYRDRITPPNKGASAS